MARRINISIPEELDKEIQSWGKLLNISKICQDAIVEKIRELKNDQNKRSAYLIKIKEEILRRKKLLIALANKEFLDGAAENLDETDRTHIKTYLEKGELPKRPKDSNQLMRVYASSCLSFPVVRRQLTRLIGKIPTPETIPVCLDKVFDTDEFQNEDAWAPARMAALMAAMQKQHNFTDNDLSSLKTKPRIIAILLDGSRLLDEKLQKGLEGFYAEISEVVGKNSEEIWRFVKKTSAPVRHVGPSLFCDFLKNIGFSEFVRVGGYFQQEFPELINEKMMTEKRQFIMSMALCQELGITPFHFDHIMYQWGRNKKFIPADDILSFGTNFDTSEQKAFIPMKSIQIPESLYNRLGDHVKGFDDTPAVIIERLLDYYESQGKKGYNTVDESVRQTAAKGRPE